MRALKAKLNSRRGASLLLALLFFLIALLVGASILMAAASNGGKAKSNRDEQQAYLTLSSALQLVVDDINGGKYTGRYGYSSEWDWDRWSYTYTYMQQAGTCSSQFLEPFRPAMEQTFSEVCKEKVSRFTDGYGSTYVWKPLTITDMALPRTEIMTLRVSGGTGDEYQAITAETVKVELTMNSDFTVSATATITTAGSVFENYSMVADFTLAVDNRNAITVDQNGTNGTVYPQEMLEWKLGKMVKGWAS